MFENEEELNDFLAGLDTLDTYKKKALHAFELSGFNVKRACEIAGISRAIFYYWKDHDWVFKKQLEILNEMEGDFVEAKLRELANGTYKKKMQIDPANPDRLIPVLDANGDFVLTDEYIYQPSVAVLIFLAKTKHKKRGYVETVDNQHTVAEPLILDWRRGIETNDKPVTNG